MGRPLFPLLHLCHAQSRWRLISLPLNNPELEKKPFTCIGWTYCHISHLQSCCSLADHDQSLYSTLDGRVSSSRKSKRKYTPSATSRRTRGGRCYRSGTYEHQRTKRTNGQVGYFCANYINTSASWLRQICLWTGLAVFTHQGHAHSIKEQRLHPKCTGGLWLLDIVHNFIYRRWWWQTNIQRVPLWIFVKKRRMVFLLSLPGTGTSVLASIMWKDWCEKIVSSLSKAVQSKSPLITCRQANLRRAWQAWGQLLHRERHLQGPVSSPEG